MIGAKSSHKRNGFDALIDESRRIRDQLIRTTAKLEAFMDQLEEQSEKLRAEIGDTEDE